MENELNFVTDGQRIVEAIDVLLRYGQIDGSHHKMWTIDKVLRILTGDKYNDIIEMYKEGEDGADTYEWDCGVAP